MVTFLMILFVILCIVLGAFILIQQGKGDLGLGSLARSSQTMFGGSGGQDFFEKTTWVLGLLYMFGALGLTILKTTHKESKLREYQSPLSIEVDPKQAKTEAAENRK